MYSDRGTKRFYGDRRGATRDSERFKYIAKTRTGEAFGCRYTEHSMICVTSQKSTQHIELTNKYICVRHPRPPSPPFCINFINISITVISRCLGPPSLPVGQQTSTVLSHRGSEPKGLNQPHKVEGACALCMAELGWVVDQDIQLVSSWQCTEHWASPPGG